MADVTDPEAIRRVREELRPICEATQALKVRILALQTEWYAGLNATIGTGSGKVREDRTAEQGVTNLTQDQVTNAVANLLALAAAVNDEIVAKPCVRAIQVQ